MANELGQTALAHLLDVLYKAPGAAKVTVADKRKFVQRAQSFTPGQMQLVYSIIRHPAASSTTDCATFQLPYQGEYVAEKAGFQFDMDLLPPKVQRMLVTFMRQCDSQ